VLMPRKIMCPRLNLDASDILRHTRELKFIGEDSKLRVR